MNIAIFGGLGHIGLTLSLKLVERGHNIAIIDVNDVAIKKFLFEEKANFDEPGIDAIIKNSREHMSITKVFPQYPFDAIIVATSELDINQLLLTSCVNQEIPILVRQTVKIGTINSLIEKGWNVCYIPERIAQGKAWKELDTLPQIITVDPNMRTTAHIIAKKIFDWVKIIGLTHAEGELAKIYTNFYRYGHFALVNQMWMNSLHHGINFSRIRKAMMDNYPRCKDMPKAGWSGGYCLPKDTQYLVEDTCPLAADALSVNNRVFPVVLSIQINRYLKEGKSVGILGVSAMPDIEEWRGSLKEKLFPLLEGDYIYHDPFDEDNSSVRSFKEAVACEVIVIGIPHSMYSNIDTKGKIVINSWS